MLYITIQKKTHEREITLSEDIQNLVLSFRTHKTKTQSIIDNCVFLKNIFKIEDPIEIDEAMYLVFENIFQICT